MSWCCGIEQVLADRDRVAGAGRERTDGRIGRCGRGDQLRKVGGTGHVTARKAGGIREVSRLHAERTRLGIHCLEAGRQAARVGPGHGMCRPILGRHQGQMQQVARLMWHPIASRDAELRSRRRSAVVSSISRRGLPGVQDDQRGHELGDRGDRLRASPCLEYSTEESTASRTMTELDRTSSLPKCSGRIGGVRSAGEAKVGPAPAAG